MQTVGYNSSKGAVISMTRDLTTSGARHNITVNAIAPGWFPTRMSGGLIEEFEECSRTSPRSSSATRRT